MKCVLVGGFMGRIDQTRAIKNHDCESDLNGLDL
jgi:hypothetical protein